jgi:predicted ester cyclase
VIQHYDNVNREKFYLLRVALSKVWDWLKLLAAYAFLIGGCYVGTRVSLEWSQHYLPLGLHLLVIAFWASVMLLWVRIISGEFGKKMFVESYVNGILWPPFVYSISLLFMAASVFASISVTLQRCGYATFEPPLPNELSPVVDFYMWHFVNLIPGLGIPETLRWSQPYRYSDHLSGAVLLIFKIAVILPVIASFKLWHDVRKTAQLKRVAKRYADAWCSQKPDTVAGFYSENGSLSVNDGPPAVGRAAIAEVARSFMRDLPDMIVTMNDLKIGEPSSCEATFHWTLTGTNTGPGGTGRRVRIGGYELWKIDDEGLIAESKGHFDAADYERQLRG